MSSRTRQVPLHQSVDKRCRRSHGRVERLAMDGPLVSRYLTLPGGGGLTHHGNSCDITPAKEVSFIMKHKTLMVVVAASLLLFSVPSLAHHGDAGRYEEK